MNNWTNIPKDSILHQWIHLLSTTEIPLSYQVAVGLSTIGALLKRNVWIDQHTYDDWGWNVYPNQSVMLVGPSGVGKDTAINFARREIKHFDMVPIIGGVTIENIKHRLHMLGTPAAAMLTAGELTAFFGTKDYQAGMVQDLTDILSSNDEIDISTKGDLEKGGPRYIKEPTLTMLCGSTEEWLHKAMPDGTMEGGFFGRFLIIVERLGWKMVPLMKSALSKEERQALRDAATIWRDGVDAIIANTQFLGEVVLMEEAKDLYVNWYYNRFKYFSKAVMPYANRSRDTVLRLAMLMALSRLHYGWIEGEDMEFAITTMNEIGKNIDKAILPPTVAASCAKEIEEILPASQQDIARAFGRKYKLRDIQEAIQLLTLEGKMVMKGGKWVKS